MNRITVAKTVGYTVATIAAASSYGHQVELLARAHLDPLFWVIPTEWVTPATVDSLAIIALIVRTAPIATPAMKRAALLPLILAGGLSIAANVATAHNLVGVIVGVWTVVAYILAELFISKLDSKAQAADQPAPAPAPAPVAVPAPAPAPLPAPVVMPVLAPAMPASQPRRTTVTAQLTVNPRTGQPYSQRHARRLSTGR